MTNFGYEDWVNDFNSLPPDEAYKKFVQVVSKDKKFLTECLMCLAKIENSLNDLEKYNDRFGYLIRLFWCYENKNESRIETIGDDYDKEFVKCDKNTSLLERIDHLFCTKIRSIKSELHLEYGILRGWYERWLSLPKISNNDSSELNENFTSHTKSTIIDSEFNFNKWCDSVRQFYTWCIPTIESILFN